LVTSTGWGNETKDNTPAFLLTANDATAVTKTCEIRAFGALAPEPCNGSTYVVPDPIADGKYTIKLIATDAAGNTGSSTFMFWIDSTMPQLTYGGIDNDRTSNTSPSIEFWASDEHEVTTRCKYDANDWAELDDCAQGPDHKPATPLTLGTHQFWIAATDSFGNVASTVYTFEVVEPGKDVPAGGGSTDTTGKTAGGATKSVPRVALVPKATKVKKGKFTLTTAVTLTPTAGAATCDGSVVVALAPKKGKAVKKSVKLTQAAGACKGTAKFKLASKLKKQKAGITVSFAGNAGMAQFTSSPLNVKL
jgi:hypothetical protein